MKVFVVLLVAIAAALLSNNGVASLPYRTRQSADLKEKAVLQMVYSYYCSHVNPQDPGCEMKEDASLKLKQMTEMARYPLSEMKKDASESLDLKLKQMAEMARYPLRSCRASVNPATGAHTHGVEGYWSCTKRMMRRQGVMTTTNDLFPTYLLEFLWRRRFGDNDLFEVLLEHIAEQYPL